MKALFILGILLTWTWIQIDVSFIFEAHVIYQLQTLVT